MANDELGRLMMEQGNERCEEKIYDLEERTAVFGEKAVHFAKRIPRSPVTFSLISQFVDSSTSIGANYCEADDAVSKKDFRHKISISKKEARETKFWLRMIVAAEPELRSDARVLWKEVDELHRIFAAIWRRCKIEKPKIESPHK